jgi:hypothetical protein
MRRSGVGWQDGPRGFSRFEGRNARGRTRSAWRRALAEWGTATISAFSGHKGLQGESALVGLFHPWPKTLLKSSQISISKNGFKMDG